MHTLLLLSSILIGAPAPKRQSVDALIVRAQTAWSRINTLRATFEQTLTNPITGSAMVSKGELQQRKPNRLSITFTEPAGDRIVADGKFVWVYLQSATPGQVIKMSNTMAGGANTDMIGQFLSTPRRSYEASDVGVEKLGNRATRIVLLVAKPGQQLAFVRAKVWVDTANALIRQFESTDANGITRRVRLLTLSPNAKVDAGAFKFRVPENVRVIEP